MTTFAIIVLALLILVTLFYLAIALYSFGVKLPKWLKIMTGVFFIVYSMMAVLGFIMMHQFSLASVSTLLVIINLLLGIFMLLKGSMPKRLKIVVGVLACILIIINILGCFAVPAMYGSVSLDMGLSGL